MKKINRIKKHLKIRKYLVGTPKRPRLAVFKSNIHIYAQIIDDSTTKTLLSASDTKESGTKSEKAYKTGQALAKQALKHKISSVVFDRGGFLYKGRIKKLAEGAREEGLKF